MKQFKSGLKDANGIEIKNGDKIAFDYIDHFEPEGKGTIIAGVVFENGAFVCKEIDFDGYSWDSEEHRPMLLYDWLKDEKCVIVK